MAEFKRHHRIVKAGHFRAVFENRRRVHGRFFSFHLLPNVINCHRLGLAVSKKVSKKAVERNRIKRHVREAFRHLQQHPESIPCGMNASEESSTFDLVMVARPAANGVDGKLLQQEIAANWERLTGEKNARLRIAGYNRPQGTGRNQDRCDSY